MKYLLLLSICLVFMIGAVIQLTEAREIAPFSFHLDEQTMIDTDWSYIESGGKPASVVMKGEEVELPLKILSSTTKPVNLEFHATYGTEQLGPVKMPPGITIEIEPKNMLLKPDQDQTLKIHVKVDKNTPSNKYDIQIVAKWPEPNGFVGTSFSLHAGKDFGPDSIAVNFFPPPLKQIKDGVLPIQVVCTNDYVLVFKAASNMPVCVSPQSASKLIERGWATIDQKPSEITSSESKLGTFYTQPQLTSAIIKKGSTIRVPFFSYAITDYSKGKWVEIYDTIPKNSKIGVVEKSVGNSDVFASFGHEVLPTGIKAKKLFEGGYFVVYLTAESHAKAGSYELSIISIDENGAIIEKLLYITVVEPLQEKSFSENIRRLISPGLRGPWIELDNISEQEYWIREDRRNPWPPSPILDFTEENIHPILKGLVDEMWAPTGKYEPSQYDKNIFIKKLTFSKYDDHQAIFDWLKAEHDKKFGRNLDDSYSSYFRYKEKIYSLGHGPVTNE